METLYLLIPLSLLLALGVGGLLWWAVSSGQYEDFEGPAYRVLSDDDTPRAAAGNEQPAAPPVR